MYYFPWSHRMNCRVNRSDPDMVVASRRYRLDPLLSTPGYHSMLGIRRNNGRNQSLGWRLCRPTFRSIHNWGGRSQTLLVRERSWSGKAKTAPRIWIAWGHLCPEGGALWGRGRPIGTTHPPLYFLLFLLFLSSIFNQILTKESHVHIKREDTLGIMN